MLKIFKRKSSTAKQSNSGNKLLTKEEKLARKEAADLALLAAESAMEEAAAKVRTAAP